MWNALLGSSVRTDVRLFPLSLYSPRVSSAFTIIRLFTGCSMDHDAMDITGKSMRRCSSKDELHSLPLKHLQ
jgi:hypothetical protein